MTLLAALLTLVIAAAPQAQHADDLTGKWSGTFSAQMPDGTYRDMGIFMSLTHKEKTLTGTAGPNEDQQWAITKGVVEGTKISFMVNEGGQSGPQIAFTLTSEGGRLKGEANGEQNGEKRHAKIDVGRVK
jgi:preprotein translocase subunit SecD